jgi:hypothetical protein
VVLLRRTAVRGGMQGLEELRASYVSGARMGDEGKAVRCGSADGFAV